MKRNGKRVLFLIELREQKGREREKNIHPDRPSGVGEGIGGFAAERKWKGQAHQTIQSSFKHF